MALEKVLAIVLVIIQYTGVSTNIQYQASLMVGQIEDRNVTIQSKWPT